MSFLSHIKEAAKRDLKTIVLPEGNDQRTIDAAKTILAEGLAQLIIIGDPQQLSLEGVQVIDHRHDARRDSYAEKLVELRKKKGLTLEQAYKLLDDELYYGVMMVKMGDADGMVAGACHSTADTLRPALQILKTAPGVKLVSSFFVMSLPGCEFGHNGTFIFSDCGLNEYPDAEALSEIALSSADSWKSIVGTEPHVAMLSYSSYGSAKSEHVDKVAQATQLVREKAPELKVDGELQFDAALVPHIAATKAPGSSVAGKADVLIFPNLDAGNIGYKIAQRLAKAEAYGPLLQGIAAPVNDLSRGCSAEDIVGVVAITAVQAQGIKSESHQLINGLKNLVDKL